MGAMFTEALLRTWVPPAGHNLVVFAVPNLGKENEILPSLSGWGIRELGSCFFGTL